MRTNIIITVARIFGIQTEGNANAQMFRAFGDSLSRLCQRLSTLFWSLLRKVYLRGEAGARANPQGISRHMTPTEILRSVVKAASQVPSLGTDPARKFGLRGCS